jgi:hypothetical protein
VTGSAAAASVWASTVAVGGLRALSTQLPLCCPALPKSTANGKSHSSFLYENEKEWAKREAALGSSLFCRFSDKPIIHLGAMIDEFTATDHR